MNAILHLLLKSGLSKAALAEKLLSRGLAHGAERDALSGGKLERYAKRHLPPPLWLRVTAYDLALELGGWPQADSESIEEAIIAFRTKHPKLIMQSFLESHSNLDIPETHMIWQQSVQKTNRKNKVSD